MPCHILTPPLLPEARFFSKAAQDVQIPFLFFEETLIMPELAGLIMLFSPFSIISPAPDFFLKPRRKVQHRDTHWASPYAARQF